MAHLLGKDDSDIELTETIVLTLGTLENVTSSTTELTLNLTSDDNPSITLTYDSISLNEGGGTSVITATQSDITSFDSTIEFSLSGTATLNEDYSTNLNVVKAPKTVAGGNDSGDALNQINDAYSNAVDSSGNLYVVDTNNNRITKWVPGANEGVLVAGGNGSGSNLDQLNAPSGIDIDSLGNLYITDNGNNRVVKWDSGATEGTVVAGGNGRGSALNQLGLIYHIYLYSDNIYITDATNNRVVKWIPGSTEGVIVAGGNGRGSALNQLSTPFGLYVDDSLAVYVGEYANHRVVKWIPDATEGTVVAGGNDQGSNTNQLAGPLGIDFDLSGNLYVADYENHRVMKWIPDATQGVLVAGTGTSGSALNQLHNPMDVDVDSSGNLYITDTNNNRIQKYEDVKQLKVSAGSTSGTVTITALADDLIDEGDETIIVTPSGITNGILTSSDATTLTITNAVAKAQTVTAIEQTDTAITLTGADSENNNLTYLIVSLPINGEISENDIIIKNEDLPKTLSGDKVSYKSNSDTATSDSFTFKANDGSVDSHKLL